MTARKDIRVDKSYINANNDIEMFTSDTRHIRNIINATPNSYKENPMMGVSINNYLNSQGIENEIKRKMMIELQGDKYQCDNPIVEFDPSGKLTINPNIEL